MNYADIKTVDIQDGTGIRVSIYVSGCHFHCKGCHNKEAWDFSYGKKFDNSTIDYILNLMNHDYIAGLSILGGEPLETVNQQGLVPLVQKVKEKFPDKTIWCYTGYDFDKDILGKMYNEFSYTRELISNIDIIVDGQFIEEKKLTDLKFRGSTNQRKIDVKASIQMGQTVQLQFGDEDRYEGTNEIKNPKIILFKEFKDKNEEVAEVSKEYIDEISIVEFDDNKEIPSMPAYQIKQPEVAVVAKGIEQKDDENL